MRWLILGALAVLALMLPGAARAAPYSSHSQLYACCTPSVTKEAMFREAKESGAAYIRVDFALNDIFDPGRENWTGPDEVAALSRRFDLPVLVVLLGTPEENTDCPTIGLFEKYRCAAVDAEEWGRQAGEIAARYAGRIDHFQVWNEPDGTWAFVGRPEEYARMLSKSYDEIRRRAPGAKVVLGPTMRFDTQGADWLARVFRTPGTDAANKFDIASIHLRSYSWRMAEALRERQAFLRGWGRDTPMWVTEHGYSADPVFQFDPLFRTGEDGQAAYLTQSMPAIAKAGAEQVFVTLRDGGEDQYAAEGIVGGTEAPFRRKPAWHAFRAAVDSWGQPEPPPPVAKAAAAPPPFLFQSAFVRSRAVARHLRRTTQRVTVSGRFRGRGCGGRLTLTYRMRGLRTTKRSVPVGADCRYRRAADLRLPARLRSGDRIRISQRFAGNAATPAGTATTLVVKPARPRVRRPRT